MSRVKRSYVVGLALMLAVPVTQSTGTAHAHDAVNFSSARYRAEEGDKNEPIVIARGTHGQGKASVELEIAAGTATDGLDFVATEKRVDFDSPIQEAEAFVELKDDADVEPPETIQLALQKPSQGMVLAFPNTALLTLIDDDGPTRISVEEESRSVFETGRFIDIWVIRSGGVSSPATVGYSTEDVTTVANEDYKEMTGEMVFAVGVRAQSVRIPILDNAQSDGNREFDLVLGPAEGSLLEEASSTRITIRDDETDLSGDDTPPYTAFHQPLQGKAYRPVTARDFLIFMQDDEGGSGMAAVQMALRKKKSNGRCAWWRGKRFERGGCARIRWSRQQPDLYTDLAYFRLTKALPASTKRNGIRFYTAYSRGIDKVGNVQRRMIKGQNKNRFEVK
jgi:hypothetical protein